MKTNWITAMALGTLSGALMACASKGATTSAAPAASAGGEPALVITDKAEWDTLAAQGKTSFDNACGTCHPGGDADLGPALKGHSESVADMTRQIRDGSGRMKPITETALPESEMKGLLVYLATMSAVGDVKGP